MFFFFFFSSRRRHTRCSRDWSSDVCSSDLYLNAKKVPQLFVLSGATKWADPKNFPWTMPGMAAYESEGVVYAKHILQTKPDAKIAILSQNDDFGRDYVAGFKRALGSKAASMII